MKKILLFVFSVMLFVSLHAQEKQCATDAIHQELLQNNPQYAALVHEMSMNWAEHVARQKQLGARPVIEGSDTIYEIPIVVHVIHTGGAVGTMYNPSDTDIEDWIEYTNGVFEGTAPGIVGPDDGGARIPIRLVLAQRDEDCNPTDGIVRVNGSVLSGYTTYGLRNTMGAAVSESSIRSLSRWDPSVYYNVYLVNKIDGEDGFSTTGGYVAGYAYLPFVLAPGDGSYMLSYIVGEETTFAHEIGHAFGLYHTFQDGGFGTCPPVETDCATQGDEVCDTERSGYTFGPCPTNSDINTCTGVNYNGVQYNVMHYGNCPDRFTPGQADRVRFIIDNYRGALAHSLGATPPPSSGAATPVAASCTVPSIYNPGNFANAGPANVFFGDIARIGDGYTIEGEYYIDHTLGCVSFPNTTSELLGSTVPLTVSIRTNPQFIRAYIDYNNDGVFDPATETVMSYDNVAPGSYTTNVTLPATSDHVGVPLRLRVTSDFGAAATLCGELNYGQTEDFSIILMPDPLSTEFLGMQASANGCGSSISWQVSSTENIRNFEIERSIDGKNFETIAAVAASKLTNNYQYDDEQAALGKNFYRLRIIDKNAKVRLSNVEVVEVACDQKFAVYPNPASNKFSIEYQSLIAADATLRVVDMLGRVVMKENVAIQAGANTASIDISSWVDGAYIIEFIIGDNQHRATLIKN